MGDSVMPKFTLTRVRLNRGGYTTKGEYFGTGAPLYAYGAEYPDTWNADHHYQCTVENPIQPAHLDTTPGGNHTCGQCGRSARRSYNDVYDYTRASDREHAKQIIRAKYPDAEFYR